MVNLKLNTAVKAGNGTIEVLRADDGKTVLLKVEDGLKHPLTNYAVGNIFGCGGERWRLVAVNNVADAVNDAAVLEMMPHQDVLVKGKVRVISMNALTGLYETNVEDEEEDEEDEEEDL